MESLLIFFAVLFYAASSSGEEEDTDKDWAVVSDGEDTYATPSYEFDPQQERIIKGFDSGAEATQYAEWVRARKNFH